MDNNILNDFSAKLEASLTAHCTAAGLMKGTVLSSPDLDGRWSEIAPEFMAEAVHLFNGYPDFTLACAAYTGIALARCWDKDWENGKSMPFSRLLGPRGFDDMDDHIVEQYLKLSIESPQARKIAGCLAGCTSLARSAMRKAPVEAQTADAFYLFAETCRVLFRIGVSIMLSDLGYYMEALPAGGSAFRPVSGDGLRPVRGEK